MKRQFICTVLLLLTIISFAQTTPSKEATIKWISEKINKYGLSQSNAPCGWLFNYSSDLSVIKKECDCKTENLSDEDLYSSYISFSSIYSFSEWKSGCAGEAKFFRIKTYGNKVSSNYGKDATIKQESIFDLFLDWTAEPDLKTRFKNALDNLVKYNMETIPKETY